MLIISPLLLLSACFILVAKEFIKSSDWLPFRKRSFYLFIYFIILEEYNYFLFKETFLSGVKVWFS